MAKRYHQDHHRLRQRIDRVRDHEPRETVDLHLDAAEFRHQPVPAEHEDEPERLHERGRQHGQDQREGDQPFQRHARSTHRIGHDKAKPDADRRRQPAHQKRGADHGPEMAKPEDFAIIAETDRAIALGQAPNDDDDQRVEEKERKPRQRHPEHDLAEDPLAARDMEAARDPSGGAHGCTQTPAPSAIVTATGASSTSPGMRPVSANNTRPSISTSTRLTLPRKVTEAIRPLPPGSGRSDTSSGRRAKSFSPALSAPSILSRAASGAVSRVERSE